MSPLFLIWLVCTSIVYKATYNDFKEQPNMIKTVVIFENIKEMGCYYKLIKVEVKTNELWSD